MKRSGFLKRRTPLRRASWFDEVSKLPEDVKAKPLAYSTLKRKTRLNPKRKKPRKDGQYRSREHLNRVRDLGYCSANLILGVTGCWMSIIDPDHMGPKPGKNIKCSDLLVAPMCRRCHSWREDRQGCFKGWDDARMETFTTSAIDLCEYYLNAEELGGHGRRRSVA